MKHKRKFSSQQVSATSYQVEKEALELENLRLANEKHKKELLKADEEREKIRVETIQLKRPFYFTAPYLLAFVGMGGCTWQFFNSNWDARESKIDAKMAILAREEASAAKHAADREREAAKQETKAALGMKQRAEQEALLAQESRQDAFSEMAEALKAKERVDSERLVIVRSIEGLQQQRQVLEEYVQRMPKERVVLEKQGGVVVAGKIVDEKGKPVRGAEVRVLRHTPPDKPMAVIAEDAADDGTFRIVINKTSKITVFVYAPSYPTRLVNLQGAEDQHILVRLSPFKETEILVQKMLDAGWAHTSRGFEPEGVKVTTGPGPWSKSGWNGHTERLSYVELYNATTLPLLLRGPKDLHIITPEKNPSGDFVIDKERIRS